MTPPTHAIRAPAPTPLAMTLTARPYQRTTVDRVKAALCNRPLMVAPTGSGKSFMLSLAVHELARRTLWLTHRKELVEQAYGELVGFGIHPGIIMAGKPHYASRAVQVASIDTARRRDIAAPELIIIDEAHHAVSKQFRCVIDRWPDVPLIGATASPFRLDNRGLGDVFGEIVEAPRVQELVDLGFLVEPKAFAPPAASVAGVRTVAGDYNRRDLAQIVDKPKLVGDIVETWLKHAVDETGIAGCYLTIGFACSVEHSKHLVAAFNAAGIPAEHVDADTPADERAAIVARFRAGVTRVLWNVALFTEGFNVPAVECIVVARPTQSLGLHIQMLGRATRTSPGKRYPIVLDHAGNLLRHGRITRHIHYSLEGGVVSEPSCLRTCPKCFRMCEARRTYCPECKVEFAGLGAGRDGLPQTVDGVLIEYEDPEAANQKEAEKEREATWWKLVHSARAMRLKPAWVSYEFKRKFGVWRDWKPIAHIVVGIDPPKTAEELLDFGNERPARMGAA